MFTHVKVEIGEEKIAYIISLNETITLYTFKFGLRISKRHLLHKVSFFCYWSTSKVILNTWQQIN
jgi:hypothetical protein